MQERLARRLARMSVFDYLLVVLTAQAIGFGGGLVAGVMAAGIALSWGR